MEHTVGRKTRFVRTLKKDKYLWLLCLPGILYFFVFHYIPMGGIVMAFEDYMPLKGILGSKWVGFKYFSQFFNGNNFWRLMRNTLVLSSLTLVFGFPAPIIIALIVNESKSQIYKKIVQTMTYLPYFISTVVIVGMLVNFVSPVDGIINEFVKFFGKTPINFMGEIRWFRTLYVGPNVWQYAGWTSIIYLAALSAIDPQIYESAVIDGAKRFQTLFYITIPSIIPTIVVMFILRMGSIMSIGFEKVILMYSPGIYETSDIISTYVYRRGLLGSQFGFGTAIGLFNSVINTFLLVSFNYISRKVSDTSLW